MRTLVRTAGLALVTLLVAVPTAGASTASLSSSVLVFQGDAAADSVTVTRAAPYYYVMDQGINPGPGCSRYNDSATLVRCRDTGNQRRFSVNAGGGDDRIQISGDYVSGTADLGAGNDTFAGGAAAEIVRGGDGDDTLRGGSANDALYGDGGNDQLAGQAGNDGINGGDGDDQLEFGGPAMGAGVGSGGDDVRGGAGTDRTSYLDRGSKVSVSLDDRGGDGTAGEADNVHGDVEIVVGSELDDTLVGNDGAQQLFGNAGFDRIDGRGGDDLLNGGTGDDELYGGAGRDRLEGSAGEDYLEGGAGDDLYEGDNVCTAEPCTGGSDFIQARDGEADTVNCGVGADTALVDDVDVVAQDSQHGCERIDRAAAVTPAPAAGALGETATGAAVPTLKLVGVRKLGTLRRGKFRIEVTCPASCRVKARLIAGRRVVASRTRTQLGAGKVRLAPKLSKRGRRALRRRSRVRMTLAVDVTDAQGTVTTLARVLTFRRG